MLTDTIVTAPQNVSKKPIEAFFSDPDDRNGLFHVYLEFILYWTGTDVEWYHHALMMTAGREEKDLLQHMVIRKKEMVRAFNVHRANGEKIWFESTVGSITHPSRNHCFDDDDFEPIRSLIDAFHCAYQKEYESLKLFEKVGSSNRETAIRNLLESAAGYQRQHILHLDAKLACAKEVGMLPYIQP